MKNLLKFIGTICVLFILPLVLLSIVLGFLATLFIDITWVIASFIAFIFILVMLEAVDLTGGAIIAIRRKLTKDKG